MLYVRVRHFITQNLIVHFYRHRSFCELYNLQQKKLQSRGIILHRHRSLQSWTHSFPWCRGLLSSSCFFRRWGTETVSCVFWTQGLLISSDWARLLWSFVTEEPALGQPFVLALLRRAGASFFVGRTWQEHLSSSDTGSGWAFFSRTNPSSILAPSSDALCS